MSDHMIIGGALFAVAAVIGTGWLLSRIFSVCKNDFETEFDFEEYKKRELENLEVKDGRLERDQTAERL